MKLTPEQLFKHNMNAFHAHLDRCKQCRENPFGLCGVGATLLGAAATTPVEPVHLVADSK